MLRAFSKHRECKSKELVHNFSLLINKCLVLPGWGCLWVNTWVQVKEQIFYLDGDWKEASLLGELVGQFSNPKVSRMIF